MKGPRLRSAARTRHFIMPSIASDEEILTNDFVSLLRELVIPPPILEWLGDAVP